MVTNGAAEMSSNYLLRSEPEGDGAGLLFCTPSSPGALGPSVAALWTGSHQDVGLGLPMME